MTDASSPNDLRDEINDRTKDWERADPHSRREFDAAEAATRAWSELDAGLTEGTMELPDAWLSSFLAALARDVTLIMPRVKDQMTLTPDERSAVNRLIEAAREQG